MLLGAYVVFARLALGAPKACGIPEKSSARNAMDDWLNVAASLGYADRLGSTKIVGRHAAKSHTWVRIRLLVAMRLC